MTNDVYDNLHHTSDCIIIKLKKSKNLIINNYHYYINNETKFYWKEISFVS